MWTWRWGLGDDQPRIGIDIDIHSPRSAACVVCLLCVTADFKNDLRFQVSARPVQGGAQHEG